MLTRIRTKLFFALAGANLLLALLVYVYSTMSFERQFHGYIRQQEDERLDALVQALAEGYDTYGNWDWITANRSHWFALLKEHLEPEDTGPLREPALRPPPVRGAMRDGSPREGRADEPSRGEPHDRPATDGLPGRPHAGPGAPVQAFTISPFILLLDAEKNIIEGPPNATMPPELKPVTLRGNVVGYLGFARRPEMSRTIDQLFAAQQKRSVLVLTLLLLATALILAGGIAHFLARPIRRLRSGTNALIDGRYEARVTISGGDELAQLAQHFNRLGETLTANRDAQRQWIADIAHELRTPLAVLQGEIEAMHDGIRAATAERITSLLQETQRLTRLVDDLHILSLSDVGGLRYRMEPFDLGELVADALETHRRPLADAAIATAADVRGPNPVNGDPMRFDQLIANLAQNTARYTDGPGTLRVAVRNDGGDVVFDWMDSSPGVRDEELPLLTDRLYRVERSRNASSGGSGLGLAIVRMIVEAHHGKIETRHSPLGGVWVRMRFRRRGKA